MIRKIVGVILMAYCALAILVRALDLIGLPLGTEWGGNPCGLLIVLMMLGGAGFLLYRSGHRASIRSSARGLADLQAGGLQQNQFLSLPLWNFGIPGIMGTGLYGRCDAVEDMFYVSTKFFHSAFLPILPLQSYIVLSRRVEPLNAEKKWRGVSIGLSLKSILLGWARTFLFMAPLGPLVFFIVYLGGGMPCGVVFGSTLLLGIISGILYLLTTWLAKASHRRAIHLAKLLQLPEEARIVISRFYGKLSREQARNLASQLTAEQRYQEDAWYNRNYTTKEFFRPRIEELRKIDGDASA